MLKRAIQKKLNREDREENIYLGFVAMVRARSGAGFHS